AETGQPIPSLSIQIMGSSGVTGASTDANGQFTADSLAPGTYTVSADSSLTGQMTVTTQVTVNAGATAQVQLTIGALWQGMGNVLNTASGLPVQKVVVYAANDQGLVISTTTDANGNYTLSGFDAGTYRIILGDPGTPGLAQTQVTFDGAHVTATA